MNRTLLAAALSATLAVAIGCRDAPPSQAIHPDLAACVPPGTQILAGIDVAALRASPLYPALPASVRALVEPLRGATHLLLASSGQDLLAAVRGTFREAPAGSTLLKPNLAVFGTPDAIRAATAQLRSGNAGAPEFIAWVDAAARCPLWIVARGTATLPLTGNLANLNRFLRSTAYTTIGVQFGPRLTLEAAAVCRSPEAAHGLEETLRAFLSLAAAARTPQPAAGLLESLRFRADGATLRITASAAPADFDPLWR